MLSQTEVFQKVLCELNEAGIDYMIVGSIAASAHGYMRDTHDLDLVVVMDTESVHHLAEKLREEFYFDVTGAEEALDSGGMFNIIHYDSSVKIDFWMPKQDEFAMTQFSRRRANTIWSIPSFVETPEDTVLSKLLWNRISPSDRQLTDVRNILLTSKAQLDYDYLRKWAIRQSVSEELNKLLEEQ